MVNSEENIEKMLKNSHILKILLFVFDEDDYLKNGYYDYSDLIPKDKKVHKNIKNKYLERFLYCFVNDKETDEINFEELYGSIKQESFNVVKYLVCYFARGYDNRKNFLSILLYEMYSRQQLKKHYVVQDGIVFNASAIQLIRVDSVASLLKDGILKSHLDNQYSRGHSDVNYQLLPGILRNEDIRKKEDKLINELILLKPNDFVDCKTTLDKLVKMQHYGLSTRLLDVTSNPLISLFFVCSENENKNGEIVFFDRSKEKKNEFSSVFNNELELHLLACYSRLNSKEKGTLLRKDSEFKKVCGKLTKMFLCENAQYINNEEEIKKLLENESFRSMFFVPTMNNQRIINQKGLFILCSDNSINGELYSLRDFWDKDDKKVFYIRKEDKKRIIDELEIIGINEMLVYPEIDHVTRYLNRKHSN